MLYIGKFINNFKDFYNEINSATLTGAIDVIVVRQPDGTYFCSPFHVRFGKIGVLRSREKVVDIEVNGSPINIHMKLGESGEAFFVEEVDDEHEIPAYLATSPLPDVPNIETELAKMKLSASSIGENKGGIQELCTVNIHSDTTELVLNTSSPLVKINCDKTVSSKDTDITIMPVTNTLELNVSNVEETIVNISSGTTNSVHTDSSDEVKTKRKRRKKVAMKKRSKTKDSSVTFPKVINIPRQTDILPKEEDLHDKPEEIFQMDDDYTEGDDEGFASSGLSRSVSLPVSANLDDLFGSEWTRRKMSSTFTGEFHPFSDGDVTPHSSPIASRPPSPKSDTEYENQKIDTVTPTDSVEPSWGWGQLPNVPKIMDTQMQMGKSSECSNAAEENKEENAVEAEKRSMLGGVLNFMRSTKKIRHMPESEGIYLSDLNADELDPELAALYFPKFKSSYCPQNEQIKDEDTESGKGPSLPHSPHTVEGYIPSQDSDSDGGLSLDQFSKEKCENVSYPYSDIAMSLCGGLQDPDIDLPEERFLHSLVTFDEFTENPGILHDPNLVIRIGGKFYNWPTAASMLTSIIMFQRPLPEKTANQLINEHMPKKKKSKSYSSWWSWRRSESETKQETEASLPQNISEVTPISEVTEDKMEEIIEEKTCDIETGECISVSVEQTVKETITTVTEVVSEVHDTLIEKSEVIQLEEVVIDPQPHPDYIETEVNFIPPSSESSTSCSSPIEIATSTREITDESCLLLPETVAQISHCAKDNSEGGEKLQNKEKYKKSLRLTSEQIAKLNLQEGPNEFIFSVTTAYQGTTKCTCQVFLWNYDDKVVISDIDGTITKSDVLGHILPMVGHSWAQLGVAKLFTKIQSNGYKFLYLSARAIGQARITREYLRRLRQGEICLPDGPLLLSPTSLISALHREVIERKPEEFKISCLKDIQTLFPNVMGNPFYAGFGNKINDTWAYRAVDIPITRVFTINHKGELKLELIQAFQSSYTRLSDDVDHVFPPIKPTTRVNGNPMPMFSSPEEFSYFTYWREPVPLLSEDDLRF